MAELGAEPPKFFDFYLILAVVQVIILVESMSASTAISMRNEGLCQLESNENQRISGA